MPPAQNCPKRHVQGSHLPNTLYDTPSSGDAKRPPQPHRSNKARTDAAPVDLLFNHSDPFDASPIASSHRQLESRRIWSRFAACASQAHIPTIQWSPNAFLAFDYATLSASFHVLRDIQNGEEITITYLRPCSCSREAPDHSQTFRVRLRMGHLY